MPFMNTTEAQVTRLLTGIFGSERVVFKMSVASVCGEQLPAEIASRNDLVELLNQYKCFCTVIDFEGNPKLVVELEYFSDQAIEVYRIELLPQVKKLLKKVGIHYVSISERELDEILSSEQEPFMAKLIHSKIDGEFQIQEVA